MKLRPKVLVDVVSPIQKGPFSHPTKHLNPSRLIRRRADILKTYGTVLAIILAAGLFWGSVIAPTADTMAQTAPLGQENRAALEAQLKDLENQISEYERTVSEYKKQGSTLKGEINRLNAQINKLNLQVKAITLNIGRLDKEIKVTSNNISKTESDIDKKKDIISGIIRDINKTEDKNMVEILLTHPTISDFFTNLNNIAIVQTSLSENVDELAKLRENLLSDKEQLSLQRSDATSLKMYQEAQRKMTESLKSDKNELLKTTKGKESEYQKILIKTRQTAQEIRNRLFHLMGGGQMTFEQAYQLATYAERATGVRAAMLLAILDQESSLGKNVGRCDYATAMHPRRDIPVFLKLVADLGLEQDLNGGKLKVSCAISTDGAYGGAMGPSQFIPSTWKLYADRISAVTGTNPPNPWNNRDAFVATALYIKDAYDSPDCSAYGREIPNQEKTLRERCAAAKYYAGNRWRAYRFAYGSSVLDRASRFEADIAVLNNQVSSNKQNNNSD